MAIIPVAHPEPRPIKGEQLKGVFSTLFGFINHLNISNKLSVPIFNKLVETLKVKVSNAYFNLIGTIDWDDSEYKHTAK